MRKWEADELCIKLNNEYQDWESNKSKTAPCFTEWRQGIPEECLTERFKRFAEQTSKSGLEQKNSFSLYSKLQIVDPAFVDRYIREGAVIERPVTGEWNLREMVEKHYGISESVYRIIEQEKTTDSRGTTRSGFETLQAMFVKGCVLGGQHSDYVVNGIKFENKGESGRLVGQERIFSYDGFKDACDQVASKYRTKSFDKALRKAFHSKKVTGAILTLLEGIYANGKDDMYDECVELYLKYLEEIPETVTSVEYKRYCIRRETRWMNGEYEVREVPKIKEVCTRDREKEVFRFIAGLMELKLYQEHSGFDVLDLCECKTGRIISIDCRNIDLTAMAKQLWGKVRFYSSIGAGTRDGAHQIGFVY